MISQHSCGKKEEREMADLRRLHRLKQGLPEGSFPNATDRPIGRCDCRAPPNEFLDAFQGYHQISLAAEDQEKTAFVTSVGNYHYKVMPFGLKNAGSTYQRMMTRMFE